MFTKMSKLTIIYHRTFVRHVSKGRSCWTNPKPHYGPLDVQRTEMLNGIKVAGAKPLGDHIAACTIMFQAGSRYELGEQLGATHFVRASSALSACGHTAYMKMRLLHQRGGFLTCTSDRQTVAFTLRCPLVEFPELKCYLLETATRCQFHEWEVENIKPLIKDDLVRIHPKQRLLDLLQRAFWAGPLSNSMFCEEPRVAGMTGATLKDFVDNNFSCGNCSVASSGLQYEETLKLAEAIHFGPERTRVRQTKCSYPRKSFEYYDLGPGSDTWIAVAVPSCGAEDLCSLLKLATLAAACGIDNVQVGQSEIDRTAQTPLGLMAQDVFTEYKAFNISYKEAGIFGILAKTRSCSARHTAHSVVKFLSEVGNLNDTHIEIGKKRLKLSIAMHEEDCVNVSEGLALQMSHNLEIDGLEKYACMIDNITNAEVLEAAREISNRYADMTIAVVGDVLAVPHDKELLFE